MVNGVNVAQAEVLNLESGAKQVLQETFGYQQFRPGQKRLLILRSPVATVWSSCPPAAANLCAIKSRVVAGRIDRRRFAPDPLMKDQSISYWRTGWRRRA